MSTEQNKAVIRRFGDLINGHDLDGVFARAAPTLSIMDCRPEYRQVLKTAASS